MRGDYQDPWRTLQNINLVSQLKQGDILPNKFYIQVKIP